MKVRRAPLLFATAVVVAWLGLRLATFNAPRSPSPGDLTIVPADQLAGVTRVVWDVDGDVKIIGSTPTLTVAGWSGDMRVYSNKPDVNNATGADWLQLRWVRQGNTLYMRASERSPMQTTPKPSDNGTPPVIVKQLYLPKSLSLPPTIRELVWPQIHLVVAPTQTGSIPFLRIDTFHLDFDDRYNNYYMFGGRDSEIQEALNQMPTGHLQQLEVWVPGTQKIFGCNDGDDGGIRLSGGQYAQASIHLPAGRLDLDRMTDRQQVDLWSTPTTGLRLSAVDDLKRVHLHALDEAQMNHHAAGSYPRKNCSGAAQQSFDDDD